MRDLDFAELAFCSHCQISVQFIWIPSVVTRLDFDKEPQTCPSPASVTCHTLHSGWSIRTIPCIIWT